MLRSSLVAVDAGHWEKFLVETQAVFNRPQAVTQAVNLLWASLAVGVFNFLLHFSAFRAINPGVGSLLGILGILLHLVIFILKISEGRNWARIIYLLVLLLGMLSFLPALLYEFSRSPIVATLSSMQVYLQAHAMYLVFTRPGSLWFRKERAV
jgi:hypothetical protein